MIISVKIVFPSGCSIISSSNTTVKYTKNFSIGEMANKKAGEQIKLVINPRVEKFANMIQEFRDWYAKTMTINSWFRTISYNSFCGGSANSLHLDGLAIDWGIKNHTDFQRNNVKTKWEQICKKYNEIGGINYYTGGYHLSIGEEKFGNTKFVLRDYRGKRGDW